jgi:hypothetical protein
VELSWFLSVMCIGEEFYGLWVQGFGVLFLHFFLVSVVPPGKYSVLSAEGLPKTFVVAEWAAACEWRLSGPMGWQAGGGPGPCVWQPVPMGDKDW